MNPFSVVLGEMHVMCTHHSAFQEVEGKLMSFINLFRQSNDSQKLDLVLSVVGGGINIQGCISWWSDLMISWLESYQNRPEISLSTWLALSVTIEEILTLYLTNFRKQPICEEKIAFSKRLVLNRHVETFSAPCTKPLKTWIIPGSSVSLQKYMAQTKKSEYLDKLLELKTHRPSLNKDSWDLLVGEISKMIGVKQREIEYMPHSHLDSVSSKSSIQDEMDSLQVSLESVEIAEKIPTPEKVQIWLDSTMETEAQGAPGKKFPVNDESSPNVDNELSKSESTDCLDFILSNTITDLYKEDDVTFSPNTNTKYHPLNRVDPNTYTPYRLIPDSPESQNSHFWSFEWNSSPPNLEGISTEHGYGDMKLELPTPPMPNLTPNWSLEEDMDVGTPLDIERFEALVEML